MEEFALDFIKMMISSAEMDSNNNPNKNSIAGRQISLYSTLKSILISNPLLGYDQMHFINSQIELLIDEPKVSQNNSLFILASYIHSCQPVVVGSVPLRDKDSKYPEY